MTIDYTYRYQLSLRNNQLCTVVVYSYTKLLGKYMIQHKTQQLKNIFRQVLGQLGN